ncbi:MAK10-like protein [Tanacetum coccineum]|uniref:MAK10-like protein n=1 Tax=Tanacetum coccineum TaxID=301880 RepID=A0ABQ4WEG2_9ASTR
MSMNHEKSLRTSLSTTMRAGMIQDHVKPVKAVAVSLNASKTPDRRLLELEDQINFLLKGKQPTPKTSSTRVPQAYAKAISSSPLPRGLNKPPRQSSFTFCERVRPNPQLQALETSFEARVRDYMASHTERMERFEDTIFKQREEINDRKAEMFRLLKELTTIKTPDKVIDTKNKVERKVDDEPAKSAREMSRIMKRMSQQEFPVPMLKEDIGGNFEIPCNIGGLKHMNALVDQGSDVNVMPLSIYNKLTDERPAETNIRLSLVSHSYIHPLGVAKDVLVDVVGYVYPMDFVILDIKEDEKMPFILGTPFLTIAKAVIKFDKGTINLRSGNSKMSFHRIPESLCRIEKWKSRIKRYIDTKPINELINYCLQNPPYKFKWTEKTIPIAEGSSETTTEGYMKNYKNVSQGIKNQLDAEAEFVQIILTGIDNDIYSTVDACPNAREMWKIIKRLK